MSILTLYLIGVLCSWIVLKVIRIKEKDDSWEAVFISFIISIGSWSGFIAALVYFVPKEKWDKILKKLEKTVKKPKWL